MEAPQSKSEKPAAKSPRAIDGQAITQGKAELDSFVLYLREEHPKDKLFEGLENNLNLYNQPFAELVSENLEGCKNDDERDRLARFAFTVYWAAKRAHDPNGRFEFDRNFPADVEASSRTKIVEQTEI